MRPYTIVRSNRRTMALEIKPNLEVVVRVPRSCPQATVEAFVAAHEEWMEKAVAAMERRRQAAAARQVTPQQEVALRQQAAQVIPQRVAYYSQLMGLTPAGIRITGAEKRFGSCSSKNNLCFSWRLMQYPPQAVDYVVVHELAHIRHHDHSPAFYALVERYMPDYRQRQALLRD